MAESPTSHLAVGRCPTGGVVVYAADPDIVAAFYEAVGSMERVLADDGFVLLRAGGFEVVVVAMAPEWAALVSGVPVARHEDSATKTLLTVTDVAQARATAVAHGGVVDPPEREWDFAGMRCCDGHDPEGNVIQVRAPH